MRHHAEIFNFSHAVSLNLKYCQVKELTMEKQKLSIEELKSLIYSHGPVKISLTGCQILTQKGINLSREEVKAFIEEFNPSAILTFV